MWIVHAGNRVDGADRDPPRFPERNIAHVEQRLRRFLGELRPTGVVSAAAAGSDVLILDVAGSLGVRTEVVLPLPVDEFERRSVDDRGPGWRDRYRRVLDTATSVVVHDLSDRDDWYLRANDVIVDHALEVADREAVLAVAVRPPPDPTDPSATDDFVARAERRGLVSIDLDPRSTSHPTAFVAMPFGTKPDPARPGVTVDCDATFRKLIVPALEDGDFAWNRADRSIESGFIHVGMLDELANSDLVVVDLTVENANVLYELGVRHALRDRSTVLIHRRGGASIFDLRPLREFRFGLEGSAITDAEALAALPDIADAVALAQRPDRGVDSPVHTLFEVDPIPAVRSRSGAQATDDFGELQNRLAGLERDRRARLLDERLDGAALDRLVADIEAARIDPTSRGALLFQLAVLLRTASRYGDALAVHRRLALAAPAGEPDSTQIDILKERAICHRRQGETAAAAGDDPEPEWNQAARLLGEALAVGWATPDTYGVAGGFEKRRADRLIRAGDRAAAAPHLRLAAERYANGVERDPTDYYLLLNRITTLRLLAQHFGETHQLADVVRLVSVAEFFASRAFEADPSDAYAAATLGELAYTRLRLDPDRVPAEQAWADAERWYLAALASGPSKDARRAMADQLEIYARLDGPDAHLDRIRRRLVNG